MWFQILLLKFCALPGGKSSLIFVHRQAFSSPRRQSRTQTPKNVAMDMQDSATPTQRPSTPEKDSDTAKINDDDVIAKDTIPEEKGNEPVAGELDSSTQGSGTLEVVPNSNKKRNPAVKFTIERSGMERSPALTVSDTDAESDREAMPTLVVSGVNGGPAEEGEREEVAGTDDEKSEKAEEGEEDAKDEVETQESMDSGKDLCPNSGDGTTNQSNLNGGDLSNSTDDLLAIMGSGEPVKSRPHTMSQNSVISLDGILGDATYFLHFRVISKSGQRLFVFSLISGII